LKTGSIRDGWEPITRRRDFADLE